MRAAGTKISSLTVTTMNTMKKSESRQQMIDDEKKGMCVGVTQLSEQRVEEVMNKVQGNTLLVDSTTLNSLALTNLPRAMTRNLIFCLLL